MSHRKYMNKDGTLKDEVIIEDIHKAAEWYEDGAILEVADLLADIVSIIEAFDANYA